MPPPHVSIFDPPPSFVPAGCHVVSHGAASISCPLVNTPASQRTTASHPTGDSTSRLPLVCLNWLPRCTSPPPLPRVASHSHLPGLGDMLPPINLRLCNRHPPSPLPPMVGGCAFQPLCSPPPTYVFSPTLVHCAVIDAANATAWVNFQCSPSHSWLDQGHQS
jgi:hypothetical protein